MRPAFFRTFLPNLTFLVVNSPPLPFGKTTTLRISRNGPSPTLFAHASKIPFLFARSSPPNDPLQQSARKNEPDRNFFFGHNLLDWTDRTLPRNPMPLVNSTLPGSISHHHAPQVISRLCIPTSLPRSQSQFLQKNILRSSFVHYPGPTRSGTLCITSTSIPNPPPTEWKGFVSRLLFTLPVFV